MKIVYINTFEGVENQNRFNKMCNFVIESNPDIVVLLELENWDKKIRLFQEKTKLYHIDFHPNIGVFSKYELSGSKKLKHEIIITEHKIKKENISLISAHLNHKNEDLRLKEIEEILKNINPNEKTILIGDLNSLSPLDNYKEDEILKKAKKLKIKKFGIDKLRKDVQTKLLKSGLIDATKEFSQKFEYSVPTNYNKDKNHLAKLRLDYIYITPNLLQHLRSAKIVRNKETSQLSDHFPIIAEFDI